VNTHPCILYGLRRNALFLGLCLGASLIPFHLDAAEQDKSGVGPNTISVPKGPGSIEGLGDAFQPSINNGTAKHAINFSLPQGPHSHPPALALLYEGGFGNGVAGFGWKLSARFIQRETEKGVPRYVDGPNGIDDDHDGTTDEPDEVDKFVSDSKEELIAVANGDYFAENEGEFIRYRRLDTGWEGVLPDGTKVTFGTSVSSQVFDSGHVFKWLVDSCTDTDGNSIRYVYSAAPGDSNANQKYLTRVEWGAGAAPWQAFYFATFQYENRTDWFEDCRSGFPIRTGLRLKQVSVAMQGSAAPGHAQGDLNGDGVADYLIRTYQLGYWAYAGAASHWSYLETVTCSGADGESSLPPARFTYSLCNPPESLSATAKILQSVNPPDAGFDSPLSDLIDLNGDGLPDLLKTSTGGQAHTVFFNQGEQLVAGQKRMVWSSPVEVPSQDGQAWNINLRSGGSPGESTAHLADMDADGLADLVYHTAFDEVFYFKNRRSQGWGARSPMVIQDEAPPSPFGPNQRTKTADIDFDKKIDVIQSQPVAGGQYYRVWFNLGGQRYSAPVTISQEQGMDLSDPTVHLADWNGDRMSDILRIQPATLEITVSLGHGRFSALRSVVIPDGPLSSEQVGKASLHDITGDGLPDLVVERPEPGVLWYWINLGNDSLAPRRIITGMPAFEAGSAVRWVDINGNTTNDYVVSSAVSGTTIQAVDLSELLGSAHASGLLTSIDNGIGRVAHLDYASSTRYAVDDAIKGQPWEGPLPFPVSVVSSVVTEDSLGHSYQTRFIYHDGYFDGVEQEFRGFGRVEVIDDGDVSAPTLVTRSYFDTGRLFKAMKGKLLRLTAEKENGTVFNDEVTTWEDPPRLLYAGTDGREVRYAAPQSKQMQIVEGGQGTARTLLSEMAYDNYGNQTVLRDYGIVENGNRSAFDDERFTTTQYALNLTAWNIRAPAQVLVSDEAGAVISKTRFFYDDEAFSGGNFLQITKGHLTLRQDWPNPASATPVNTSRTRYDAYGNPAILLDPLAAGVAGGHVRRIDWDTAFHAFPVTETIQLGEGAQDLVFQASYDPGFGAVVSSTDFNNRTTTFGHDALGRIITIARPGDAPGLPASEFTYQLAVPLGGGRLVNYIETRTLDRAAGAPGSHRDHYLIKREFVDGMGRALLSKLEAEPDPEDQQNRPRVRVSGASLFNARRGVQAVISPFFSSLTGTLDDQLAFEDPSAPGWTGIFPAGASLAAQSLATAPKMLTSYDATLRAISTTQPDGAATLTVHEPLVTRSFDENDSDAASPHHSTPMVHYNDGLGRLVRVDEMARLNDDGTPTGVLSTWITRYQYDLNDQLTRITDSQGNVKTFAYDGLKRKTAMNDPDRGVMSFLYDSASNLIETTDAKNQRITYTYDGANRIRSEDYHDEAQPFSAHFAFDAAQPISASNRPDVAYFYDSPVAGLDVGDGSVATASNAKGKLAYVWDLSGEEHTSYDERDRILWVVKRVRDPLHGQLVSYRTGFGYDTLDRVTSLTYPDNDRVGYDYDSGGHLARITGGPGGTIISALAYQPSDQQRSILYGNGVRTSYTYDARLRLKSLITAPQSAPASPLIAFGYDFDAASNITAIHDNRPASVVPAGDKRRNTQLFQYDDLYRLTRVQYSFTLPGEAAGNHGEVNYRYDRIGNMLAQTSSITDTDPHTGLPVANLGSMASGGSAGRSNRIGRAAGDPPGPHALTSISAAGAPARSYPYDENGNMTNLDGMVATWDFKDRLVALEDATMRAEYSYDFTDRRITKRVSKKAAPAPPLSPRVSYPYTTIYVGKHFEVREFDAPTKYIFHGDTRVARVTGMLSPDQRVQRLRVHAGWNLLSVAVTAANGGAQLAATGQTESIHRWDPEARSFALVQPADTLSAGTVLWVKASASATLRVMGTYPGPRPNLRAPPQGEFLPSRGLEVLPLTSPPATLTAWRFAPEAQTWQTKLSLPSLSFSDLPPALAPQDAVYAKAPEGVDLELPDPALSLRYYHQDHLGSSSVMSDASGALVEESANYAFGSPRSEFRPRGTREEYQFTQKERDAESTLSYFEARYLAGRTARFVSVDPLALGLTQSWLTNPQKLNLYSYCANRPLICIDPTGLDGETFLQNFWEGATKGDFAERDTGWGGVAGQTLSGFIPIYGQAADIRDLAAAGSKISQEGLTLGTGLGMAAAAVAVVPGFDWVKGGKNVAKNVAGVVEKQAAKTTAVADGRFYSTAFETKLPSSVFGKSDKVHFNRANAALDDALRADADFAARMEQLSPGIADRVSSVGGRQNPAGFTWHHDASPGVMQLVPTTQHTPGSIFWRTLHPDPGAAGGYSIWAIPAGAPKR
jgi:RHS repeat-associated protein